MAKRDLTIRVKAERDLVRLFSYRHVLRAIVEKHNVDPYSFSGEEAADMAREVLSAMGDLPPADG